MTETKQVTDFLADLYQGQTKQEQKSTDSLSPERMKLLEALMRETVNCGLLSDKEKIRHWCNRLGDKSDREIIEGIRKLQDCTGPLTLPKLRELCVYIPPLSERISLSRRLEQKKSDPKTIEYWKQKRKAEVGI